MSSRDIISYVKKQTGKRITISLKSKKSIIKKAMELLGKKITKKSDERVLGQAYTAATDNKFYPKEKAKEIKKILRAMESCIKDLLKIL
jgi:hypothetical protein